MKVNIVICDGDSAALKANSILIEGFVKGYKVDADIFSFTNGEKVIEFAEANVIDIAFLDILLNGMSGIVLAAKLLKKNPRIFTIFITQHREYAYDAYTVEAYGYLIKPYEPERLERIFRKAIQQVNDMYYRMQHLPLIITEDNIKKKISQMSIRYIKRENTKSIIITRTSVHYVYETITSLAGRLEDNFVQISQSIIINLDETEELQLHKAVMKTGEIFTIGRTYIKEAKKKYLDFPRV
jgi:DNA-binding LytR/AlgR family response regulator